MHLTIPCINVYIKWCLMPDDFSDVSNCIIIMEKFSSDIIDFIILQMINVKKFCFHRFAYIYFDHLIITFFKFY